MSSQKEKIADGENLYHIGLDKPAAVFGDYELYIDPDLSKKMDHPVATWGGENSAIVDGRAYDILERHTGGEKEKLEKYLRALTEFEINYSGNQERHKIRTPIEEEILDIMKKNGYFD